MLFAWWESRRPTFNVIVGGTGLLTLAVLLARLWGDEVAPVGPTLFRHGLVFSVGLTLFPIGVGWVAYLWNAAKWVLVH